MNWYLSIFLIGWVAIATAMVVKETDLDKIRRECKEQEGATDTELEEYMRHSSYDYNEPMSRMSACMCACNQEKKGIMKDGQFNYYGTIRRLFAIGMDEENAKEFVDIANACRDVRGTDRCDTAKKILECVKKNISHREMW